MRKRPTMIRIPKDSRFYSMTYKGYIYPARLAMAEHLNRCLGSDEYIYFIDGNPLNADISNLQLVSHKELTKMHKIRRISELIGRLGTQLSTLQEELTEIRFNHTPCSCPKCKRSKEVRQAEYKLNTIYNVLYIMV